MTAANVSVVIPTYNSGPLVVQAVESALAQTVPPAEVIVVDDGSQDDTRARLERFHDRIRYVHQPNQGVSATRNHGIELATGDYVAFLDADDVWHPRKTELQLATLARHSEVGLLGARCFDWPIPIIPAVEAAQSVLEIVPRRRLLVKNCFITSTVIVSRRLLQQAGPFDTTLQGPEDYDLWLRISELTATANLTARLTGYRDITGSLSKQAARMEAGMQAILRKLDDRQAWQGQFWLRRKAHSYVHSSCAYMYGAAGQTGPALVNVGRSLIWYPWPFDRSEVRTPFARLKMLGAFTARLIVPARLSKEAVDG